MLKIAASSLILGTAIAPVNASNYGHETAGSEKAAAQAAEQARKLMGKRKFSDAVEKAEEAVAAMPRFAEYRALLGQAYLSAGRFQSAETTLGEAASLDPSNARAGLNLVLAQIANARNDRALATLDAYRERLSAVDFGLAAALAGDLAGATNVLEAAVRDPAADAKTRQNLALTYALANRWREARIMAAQDLSGEALYARMTEWAAFTVPSSSSQQVANLLRVTPVADPGQPAQLALGPTAEVRVALAPSAPAIAADPAPAMAADADPAPVFEVSEAPPPAAVATVEPVAEPVRAAAPARSPSSAIRQVVLPASDSVAARSHRSFRPVQSGTFVVQLGAFSTAARAEAAWQGASGRFRALDNYSAATARVQVKSVSLYRLSVSGFATRAAAGQVCARIKAAGGDCFVRSIAGDTPLQWASAKGGTRLASRN
jgi:Flp pilus assembly protein TadD